MRFVTRIGVIAASGLVLLPGCSGSSSGNSTKNDKRPAAATTTGGTGGAQLEQQYEQVVQNVLPSVVQITTDSGLGSGVVYDTKGDIVTNDHVVAGARKLQVTPATGNKALPATLVGEFPADDLAVVKVTGASLKAAVFGDSSKLKVGQIVLAMGNPLGLSGSVSNGIVSALGRTVSSRGEGAFQGATTGNAIQTSAAINPGNSGGALVTLTNEVVGIPTLAASDPQMGGAAPGIGFAIPSSTVKSIADQLISAGKVTNSGRAAIGVSIRTVVDATGRPGGVGIVTVQANGPAAKAGMRPGDVITALNGTPTPSDSVLSEMLATLKPGDQAQVSITRSDGSTATVTVTLGQLSGG